MTRGALRAGLIVGAAIGPGCDHCPDQRVVALGTYSVESERHDREPLVDATLRIDRETATLHYFLEDGSEWELEFSVHLLGDTGGVP